MKRYSKKKKKKKILKSKSDKKIRLETLIFENLFSFFFIYTMMMMHTHRDSTSWDFDESSGGGRIKKKIELFYLIKIYARLFVRWQDSRQDIRVIKKLFTMGRCLL